MQPRSTLPAAPISRLTLAVGLLVTTLGVTPAAVAAQASESDPDRPFRVEVRGTGPAMILIPGMTSSGSVWDATAAHFADRYEVHVLTLAGFAGVPPVEADPFLRTQRDAIVRYVQAEGLERPVIVGHSLGGFLAYWVAATDPDAVGPVVAVDGVPFLTALQQPDADETTMASQAQQMAAFYATMSEEQMRQQSRMAARAMVGDSTAVDTIAAWGARSDAATAGRAFAEMMTTDLRDDVGRITAPLLLVMAGGGLSDDVRERMRAAYTDQLSAAPRGRVVVAEGARHFVMLDDPAFLHRTVEAFLAEAREGGSR